MQMQRDGGAERGIEWMRRRERPGRVANFRVRDQRELTVGREQPGEALVFEWHGHSLLTREQHGFGMFERFGRAVDHHDVAILEFRVTRWARGRGCPGGGCR